jgi:hypothetical protein
MTLGTVIVGADVVGMFPLESVVNVVVVPAGHAPPLVFEKQ